MSMCRFREGLLGSILKSEFLNRLTLNETRGSLGPTCLLRRSRSGLGMVGKYHRPSSLK